MSEELPQLKSGVLTDVLTGDSINSSFNHRIVMPCDAPAPLVVNGGGFCGCPLPRDHEGEHAVTVKWRR